MGGFSWPVRVYYEDTDGGGIVYYANYLKFMERARTEWLRHLGYEQDALISGPGILFVVQSLSLQYVKPAYFNDSLCVETNPDAIRHASLIFSHRVTRSKHQEQGELLVTGKVRIACVDAESYKPKPLPKPMLEDLKRER